MKWCPSMSVPDYEDPMPEDIGPEDIWDDSTFPPRLVKTINVVWGSVGEVICPYCDSIITFEC